jgi:hypothetical protein
MQYKIHPSKVSKYLLDLTHKTGSAKAKFFLEKGFSLAKPDELVSALVRHPLTATLQSASAHPDGLKLRYECDIATPSGSLICIRSIWIEASDRMAMTLVTAYPFR